MIKDKAKSVVRKKTSGSVKQQKRSGSISTELSQNCRCICSSVCSIEVPDSITTGTEKTYTGIGEGIGDGNRGRSSI
jgi:hypothetical protein